MLDLLVTLIDRPTKSDYLSIPVDWFSDAVKILALILLAIIMVELIVRRLPKSIVHEPAKMLSWPKVLNLSWRPASVLNGLSACGLIAVSVLLFACYIALGAAMIFFAPEASQALKAYMLAGLFMFASLVGSRGFMIAGVKQWHGLR